MEYCYFVSYDQDRDDFSAFVAVNSDTSDPVYQISSTAELVELLNTGIMDHLDDIAGLEAFLKRQEFLMLHDSIKTIQVLY